MKQYKVALCGLNNIENVQLLKNLGFQDTSLTLYPITFQTTNGNIDVEFDVSNIINKSIDGFIFLFSYISKTSINIIKDLIRHTRRELGVYNFNVIICGLNAEYKFIVTPSLDIESIINGTDWYIFDIDSRDEHNPNYHIYESLLRKLTGYIDLQFVAEAIPNKIIETEQHDKNTIDFVSNTDIFSLIYPHLHSTDISSLYSANKDVKNTIQRERDIIFEKCAHKQPHGLVDTHYDNGQIKTQYSYRDSKLYGEFKEWNEIGQLMRQKSYKHGKLEGEWKEWNENGQLKLLKSYKDGKLEGEWKEWFDNGQSSLIYNYKNGEQDGTRTEWYENGKFKQKYFRKNSKVDGEWIEWYENGQLKSQYFYIDGKREGMWKSMYENGQLKSQYFYKDGKSEGVFKSWYENKRLQIQYNYNDGKLNGKFEEFYENGGKRSFGIYIDGKPEGLFTKWKINGDIESSIFYKNGESMSV
jgi:antitoxin component YwqK of YwqJK toxin-antitoxin module